ncbi:MAG: phosphotransferase [Pseudomonadota bacterium]|nr:phosphotransferase [Pseudomonadota bacterium]
MPDRSSLIEKFLDKVSWGGANRLPLKSDASFRKYERIKLPNKNALLMDAIDDKKSIAPFLSVTQHLRSFGYSAPKIFAYDQSIGLVLLEDLGERTFTQILKLGNNEKDLYQCATDFLIDMHDRAQGIISPDWMGVYSKDKLFEEVLLLAEWFLPSILGKSELRPAIDNFMELWKDLLPKCLTLPNTLVLRDFHADNLFWLKERGGVKACGVIDYQDALNGPPAYDLMSLLEDARRDLSPGLQDEMVDRYLLAFPKMDKAEFRETFSMLAAQRHCKVLGIFSRLSIRDSKHGYLGHLPRVLRLLNNVSIVSSLSTLREWLEHYKIIENGTELNNYDRHV